MRSILALVLLLGACEAEMPAAHTPGSGCWVLTNPEEVCVVSNEGGVSTARCDVTRSRCEECGPIVPGPSGGANELQPACAWSESVGETRCRPTQDLCEGR